MKAPPFNRILFIGRFAYLITGIFSINRNILLLLPIGNRTDLNII